MAAIYRGPTKGYKLTQEDTEWLARSLWGECKGGGNPTERDAAAVAWAMIQRFMLMRMKWQWERWTFAGFIRAFSQPVNPRWLPDAPDSLCPAHPQQCGAGPVSKRRKIQSSTWAEVPAKCREFAEKFRDGQLASPFGEPIYDFAGCGVTSKGLNIGGNCFYRYADLSAADKTNVIPGTVSVEKFPWLYLLAAGGLLAYLAYRAWKKEKP